MEIYRSLALLYKYTPEEIANMTPFQQSELLNLDDETSRNIIKFNTAVEYFNWLQKK